MTTQEISASVPSKKGWLAIAAAIIVAGGMLLLISNPSLAQLLSGTGH